MLFFFFERLLPFSSMLIFSCRYFKRKFVPISIKFLIPQTKSKTAIERFTYHLLTENHVNIYIIQYGKIRKSHFWNGSNHIKVILVIIVLFVLSVNLMVNYLYRKYGVQIHIFSPDNGTWGTNYLKCESENVKNTLLLFFYLFWEYKFEFVLPFTAVVLATTSTAQTWILTRRVHLRDW